MKPIAVSSPSHAWVRAVTWTAAVLLALSSALLVSDRWADWLYPEQLQKLRELGAVDEAGPELKRKLAGDFRWTLLREHAPVYAGDSLFTGAESTAAIRLTAGGTLHLEPYTLLVLRRTAEATEIELHQGRTQSTLDAGQKLVVRSRDTRIELEGSAKSPHSRIQLAASAPGTGRLSVQVKEGEVRLKSSGGRQQTLQRDQQAQLTGDGRDLELKTFRLAALAPADGDLVFKKEDELVTFSWKGAAGVPAYRIEAAYDPEFRIQLVSQPVEPGSCAPSPAAPGETTCTTTLALKATGVLHWRAVSTSGESSPVARFKLYYSSAPAPLEPAYGAVMAANHLVLRWSDRSGGTLFRVEVAKDREFAPKGVVEQVSGPAVELAPLPDGTYYWRTRSSGADHPGQWSQPSMFVVQRELLPNAPQSLEPQDGATVPLAAGGAQVAFRWAPLPGASEYVIEISSRPDFAPLLFTDRLARTSYTWTQTAAGTYYWRLRATQPDGRATVYGAARTFVIR